MIDIVDLTLGGITVGNAYNVSQALKIILKMYKQNKHQYTYCCLDNDVDVIHKEKTGRLEVLK